MPATEDADTLARAELLREALLDFKKFCRLLTVKSKSGAYVPFVLNEVQKRYLAARTLRDILLKPRQVGMTTLLLILDIFFFLTVPGANVVIVVQSKLDNKPMNDLCDEINRHLDRLETCGLKLDFQTRKTGSWKLAGTGNSLSVIVAGASPKSAEKIGRSGMVTHLHCTEIAFWDRAEEAWNAIKQCVPDVTFNTSIVWESTPNGMGGLYYEEFRQALEGRSDYKAHFFPWYMQREYRTALDPGEEIVPVTPLEAKLDPEQVKWYRRKASGPGGRLAIQEFPSDPDSCFLAQGRSFFDTSRVLEMISAVEKYEAIETFVVGVGGSISPLDVLAQHVVKYRSIRIFHRPVPRGEYVLALDVSSGAGLDAGAGCVLERGTGRHMATLWGQFRPEELACAAAKLAKEYHNAMIAVERQNHGDSVRVALLSDYRNCGLTAPYTHIFHDSDRKFGWSNTFPSRTLALDHFEQAVRTKAGGGGFETKDIHLLREMKDFVIKETASGKERADHERGKHDDILFAAVIGWSVICRRRVQRDLSALPPG